MKATIHGDVPVGWFGVASCNNVYKGTIFPGYVELMTRMKPDKLTMSLDQQNKDDWQENAFEIVYIYIYIYIYIYTCTYSI